MGSKNKDLSAKSLSKKPRPQSQMSSKSIKIRAPTSPPPRNRPPSTWGKDAEEAGGGTSGNALKKMSPLD